MIESIRLMAIIRDVEPVYAVPIAETLVSEGITGIEVSLSDAEKDSAVLRTFRRGFRRMKSVWEPARLRRRRRWTGWPP